MAAAERVSADPIESLPLLRHEILHRLRGSLESYHRRHAFMSTAHMGYMYVNQYFSATDLDQLPEMNLDQANDYCNRTAPFYFLRNESAPEAMTADTYPMILAMLLAHHHNYVYEKWFRPYRSDIEFDQFLAKVIVPNPTPLPDEMCSQYTVDLVCALNENICARVDRAQAAPRAAEHPNPEEEPLSVGSDNMKLDRGNEYYILQPLFRAIAIVLRGKHYTQDVSDLGSFPALIVLTGVDAGLSSPITFDSIPQDARKSVLSGAKGKITAIETTLETAVDFLMGLEQREIAAYGPRPDPTLSTQDPDCPFEFGLQHRSLLDRAKKLGWNEDMGSLEGPSSEWVDMERYPTWTGDGAADAAVFPDFHVGGLRRKIETLRQWRAQQVGTEGGQGNGDQPVKTQQGEKKGEGKKAKKGKSRRRAGGAA